MQLWVRNFAFAVSTDYKSDQCVHNDLPEIQHISLKKRSNEMSIFGAIVAGLVSTVVITLIMAMAPKMGMPKMDMVGMLGSMFGGENRTLGLVIHLMMGTLFALLYAYLWSVGIGSPGVGSGAVFGIVHWLIVGLVMGGMPMMHAGIKSGAVQAPGVYMTKNGGAMGFMGGLIGHIVFGIVVALVYAAF